jgi:coproporphyrinogen III oxidase-like Fe-S oxidoreductase
MYRTLFICIYLFAAIAAPTVILTRTPAWANCGRYTGTALAQEVAQVGDLAAEAGAKRPLQTIFFGGGTPSLMPLDSLARC